FEPTPESISRIWFAPNHLRAFRRCVYEEIGGYNVEMKISDDQELMCRLYTKTKFKHIDKGLYVYRIHGENTWLRYNDEIQQNVYKLYDQYIQGMAERWASSQGLKVINLGDKMNFEHADSSVGVLKAWDVIQLLRDPTNTMQEISRVLDHIPGFQY